jgi:hypothetical protein
MDRGFSYGLVILYQQEMDRTIAKIRQERELARLQRASSADHSAMALLELRLADMLIKLGMRLKARALPKGSVLIPRMMYRQIKTQLSPGATHMEGHDRRH